MRAILVAGRNEECDQAAARWEDVLPNVSDDELRAAVEKVAAALESDA